MAGELQPRWENGMSRGRRIVAESTRGLAVAARPGAASSPWHTPASPGLAARTPGGLTPPDAPAERSPLATHELHHQPACRATHRGHQGGGRAPMPRRRRRSYEKLAALGPSAIPRIIDALASADNQETAGFVRRAGRVARQQVAAGGRGGTRGRQPAHRDGGHHGAVGRAGLQPPPAAHHAGRPGHAEGPAGDGDRRAEVPAQPPRGPQARLQPGAGGKGGAVPHRGRDRRREPACRSC